MIRLDAMRGPVTNEYARRETRRHLLEKLCVFADSVQTASVVVVGWLMPQLRYELQGGTTRGKVTFVYTLKENALEYYSSHGFDIRYLRGMDQLSRRRTGADLSNSGAFPLEFE